MTTPGFGRSPRDAQIAANRRLTTLAVLRSINPPGLELPFLLDPEQVTQVGGTGGWSEVVHPKITSTTEYDGMPLRQLTFPTMWDGWRTQTDVESQLATLERWGRIEPGRREPAILRFLYGTYSRIDFVLNGLEYGPELRNSRGLRLRAEVTITLLEHRDANIVLTPAQRATPTPTTPAPGQRPSDGNAPTPSGRVYTVKSGDTLSGIAQRELGKASRWPEIAQLNGLRDPNRITPGQQLRLPA